MGYVDWKEIDRLSKENERLRGLLNIAGLYVALCPPPPEFTGPARIEILEYRRQIAQASADEQ